jgi:hypothetical protein
MKTDGGVDVQIHVFLTSAIVGGEWSASSTGRFTPRGKNPHGSHWIEGWAGPEPVWTTWRSEDSYHHRGLKSDPLVVQPVASRYTDCAIPALTFTVRYI